MDDKLLKVNTPSQVVECTQAEAEELGAFEETAMSEADALEATELQAE